VAVMLGCASELVDMRAAGGGAGEYVKEPGGGCEGCCDGRCIVALEADPVRDIGAVGTAAAFACDC